MIIDLILDRKCNDEDIAAGYTHYKDYNGNLISLEYDPKQFYNEVMEYSGIFDHDFDYITAAMDYGTEKDVKNALCKYIDNGNYNPDIKDYIRNVNWLK